MGLAIERDRFEDEEFDRFRERLEESLRALQALLARPGFGEGRPSLGAELELSLVGDDARPRHANLEVLGETDDPRMTVELDRFNLEANLRHSPLASRPFQHLRDEMEDALSELSRAAERHAARVATVGILPTLGVADLAPSVMTNTPRFRALSWALQRDRHEPFSVRISGEDSLEMECPDVTLEGAATSLQLHLRVSPSEFSRVFNSAQLATPAVLAVAANSPTLLGRRLWDETRVALFKQAVDVRSTELERLRQKPRVSFGTDWNRGGAFELFAEAVRDFPPLLPVLSDEDPEACVARGDTPRLGEMRLHQGTVWSWNRPVYDPAEGGHLRIELRALPAGPSVPDMVANAAFLVGLALGLSHEMDDDDWRSASFPDTHGSFYRAARLGLEAPIAWPAGSRVLPGVWPARELVPELLPVARSGLLAAGVEREEVDVWLELIAERCDTGITGAVWQRRALAAAERDAPRDEALRRMFSRYLEHGRTGTPVHRWPADA